MLEILLHLLIPFIEQGKIGTSDFIMSLLLKVVSGESLQSSLPFMDLEMKWLLLI
jgi:hypothetical protein